jgi:crossover junction endodeoxyribonuclease RuvC
MIVLGLDPGVATTGYGVLSYIGSKFTLLDYGIIKTLPKTPFSTRLKEISDQLSDIIITHKPETIAIEDLFFTNNAKTAIAVAQARGVLILTSEQHNIKTHGYTPPQVKSSVCGYGKAEKKQVQYMVQKILNMNKIPKPDDAADALAIAICHSHSFKMSHL